MSPPAALLALLAALPLQEDPLAVAGRALAAERYGAAAAALAEAPPSAARARLWTQLYYAAGVPRRALAHAEEGLAQAPEDLELLHRAASSALWVGDAGRAQRFTARLAAAVGASDLGGETRAGWQAAVEDFERRVGELEARGRARSSAVARARGVVALMAALAGAILFRLSR